MKCAQFPGVRNIELTDVEQPIIKNDDDVLIRVGSVGVCGSDIHYYVDGRIGDQIIDFPYVPGHECSGTVVKTGKKVKHIKPGDKIAVEPAISCGKCDQCLAGRENTCRELKFLGTPGELRGCMTEYLIMPERNCFLLPAGMTLEQGAFAEPLSISIYGLKYVQEMTGKKMAILGSGPIGLTALLEARFRGAETLYVTDKLDNRLLTAKKCGADWIGNPDDEDIVQAILEKEPLGLDVVAECCGKQEAIDQAVELLKPGGMLLLIGIPTVDRISFNISRLRRKEITIHNVRRQNDCLGLAVERIYKGQVKIDSLITHSGHLSQTKEFYDMVADYQDGVIKAMITI